MNLRLLGVVLCGGRSSRMGRDKSALPHPDGGTFLSHAIGRLAGLCDEVCVAGLADTDSQIRVLVDPVEFRGPVTGILSAVSVAEKESFDGCLITPVDMPLLTSEHLNQICEVWRRQPDQVVCGVDDEDQRVEPLMAIYPSHLGGPLGDLAKSEDRSLNRWIRRQDYVGVALPARCCANINTPDDLAE